MEEPGGLPSMGAHRVVYNQNDLAAAAAAAADEEGDRGRWGGWYKAATGHFIGIE